VVGLLLGGLALAMAFHRSYWLARQGDPAALLTGGLITMAVVGGFTDVSHLNLEYESVLIMISLGVMVFASWDEQRGSA